jgi:hypothetical protein
MTLTSHAFPLRDRVTEWIATAGYLPAPGGIDLRG